MKCFFPSYVGSKKYWVRYLQEFAGKDFVEPFCGSASLSANLARTALLNDTDPFVCLILEKYDELLIPNKFGLDEYFKFRSRDDWWKYIYCLQKMSFSGVFRWSKKSGYNVPCKRNPVVILDLVKLKEEYKDSLSRWKELSPTVYNKDYREIGKKEIKNKILVLDPPYEKSQASYNKTTFDYNAYWDYVENVKMAARAVLLFDRKLNFKSRNIPVVGNRKMRVNGGLKGDVEALAIFENGKWREDCINGRDI